MLAPELKAVIDKLWDRFWAGGLSNPLTAIEQMSYLIFMKRLEDLDEINAKRFASTKINYPSTFKDNEDCRWSHWKHFDAIGMMDHIHQVVFPFIKNLGGNNDSIYSQFMKDATFVIPKASLLQEAVSILDGLNITEQNQDTQGDIYEYLLSQLTMAGKNGQFRTPRHIIRMMVDIIQPEIGHKICDPACGTSGFLIGAYEHILKKYTSDDILKIDNDGSVHNLIGDKIVEKSHWNILKHETLHGFDFDTTMVRIGLMNMMLHGIDEPNIKYADTLSKKFEQKEEFDIVLANPPFSGSIDKSDIHDAFTIGTTKTELLFTELFINLLQIGGKAAVIVPNGVLFGSSNAHKKIKKKLLEQCRLDAVISMPSGVFKPYAGVSTAVLIFTKGEPTKKVWFYNMEKDGFSLDDKRTFIDGKGDIPDILNKFKDKEDSDQSKLVTIEEIQKNDYNLSSNRYIQNFEEEEQVDIPQVLQELKKLENERKTIDEKVKGYMKELGYDN